MILFLFLLFGFGAAFLFPFLIPSISFWWAPLFFLVGILFLAILLAVVFYCLPKTVFSKPDIEEPVRRWFLHEVSRFVITVCRIRLKVSGFDKIPDVKPVVFIGNHLANWDIIIMMFLLKKHHLTFVFKKEIDEWPFINLWTRSIGGLPVDRMNDRKSAEVIVEMGRRVKEGHNYIIFPEGTRSRNGYVADFRHGSVKPAVKAGVDTVIFSLDNTYRVKMRWPRMTKVHVDFVKVLKGEQVASMSTIELAEEAKRTIEEQLEKNRSTHPYLIVPEHIRKEKNKKFKKES